MRTQGMAGGILLCWCAWQPEYEDSMAAARDPHFGSDSSPLWASVFSSVKWREVAWNPWMVARQLCCINNILGTFLIDAGGRELS